MRGWLLFLVLFFLLSFSVSAEDVDQENQNKALIVDESSQFALAQHFFDEKQYFRAITEYKRFIFFFPQSNLLEMAYFKIGEAYFKGKKWKQAILAFKTLEEKFPKGELIDKSLYLCGMAYLHRKEYLSSRKQFRKIINDFSGSKINDDAGLQIAMSYVEEEKWHDALMSLKEISKESDLYNSSRYFASGLEKIHDLPHKSPALAGTFAAILPGSGHFYTGRKRDGTTAFLLNGAFIWGALEAYNDEEYVVAGILTFFELGWYFGNIYSAASSAHKYNKRVKDGYIENLKKKISISMGTIPTDKSYFMVLNFRF